MMISRVLKERVRRTQVLFRELGYRTEGKSEEEGVYSGSFESPSGFEGGFLVDQECRFLELAFSLQINPEHKNFVREKLEEMLSICYDYGCYISLDKLGDDLSFSVYSKIYWAGLNYYALKETLYDFIDCVDTLTDLLDPEDKGRED
jgi:hypothetical protein